jgi:HSP20 family molecular chaperone IbpA
MVESTPKREDFTMTQVHKRFTAEQVKILFQGYCQGNLSRSDIEGEAKQENEEEKATYHYRELRYGLVRRSITLPVEVNAEKTAHLL